MTVYDIIKYIQLSKVIKRFSTCSNFSTSRGIQKNVLNYLVRSFFYSNIYQELLLYFQQSYELQVLLQNYQPVYKAGYQIRFLVI